MCARETIAKVAKSSQFRAAWLSKIDKNRNALPAPTAQNARTVSDDERYSGSLLRLSTYSSFALHLIPPERRAKEQLVGVMRIPSRRVGVSGPPINVGSGMSVIPLGMTLVCL
jgi:hypothetical protein